MSGVEAVGAALATLGAGRGQTPRSVEEAAKQVQVTFMTQLLSAMRKTVPESDFLPKSAERDVYDGEFDRAVAEALAARDPLGLVQQLAPRGAASSSDARMSITAVDDQQTHGALPGRRSNP